MEVCGRYGSWYVVQSGRSFGDSHRTPLAELETLSAGVCTELHSLSTMLLVRYSCLIPHHVIKYPNVQNSVFHAMNRLKSSSHRF